MLVWENLLLARRARDRVLFCPSYSRPLLTRCRTVVTTHDAVQQIYPGLFPLSVRLFYNRLYGWSARHATLVITDSEAGRDDIVRHWHVARQKIRVIYLAPADFVRRIAVPAQSVRAITGSSAPFFLFVGKISGRRNLPCLLESFARFKHTTGRPHALVLAGLNPRNLNLGEMTSRLRIDDSVKYCEFLADEQINLLYNAAQALVMPSVYETVSLPVMEAQAVGTPVICIDTGGMREITGGAALFVNSLEPELLAQAMTTLTADAGLRARLSEDGVRNAARFSWDRCAAETMAVMAEAAGLPQRW
jgi:glycosyltransferase involved in cell wall biosynthesis